MSTSIFIRTYAHDREYHEQCLRSIEKFCSGFGETVVIDGEHPKGYLRQQVDKVSSDLFCPGDTDFVLITDSDTVFTAPVTPDSFMVDGKPVWIHTPWNPEMFAHQGLRAWFNVMTDFFGTPPPSEFMRRHPFIIPCEVLRGLRDYCKMTHGKTIEDYIMNAAAFSEFNVIGFYGWLFHRDKFHWVNSETDELPTLLVRQFWSHDPIAKNIEEINRILQ